MTDELDLTVRRPVGAVLSVRVGRDLAVEADEFARQHAMNLSELVRLALQGFLAAPPTRVYWSMHGSTTASLTLNSPAAGLPQPTVGRAQTENRAFAELTTA